jgi:hypothetical protein
MNVMVNLKSSKKTKRRKQNMKKIIYWVAVALIIASVAFAAPKIKITAKDLPGLKGTWEGILSFGAGEKGRTSPVKLEILTDKVPVKAKLTITDMPNVVAMQFGDTGGQKVVEADERIITSQGTLMWTGPAKNFFEVTLTSEKKLDAWYFLGV